MVKLSVSGLVWDKTFAFPKPRFVIASCFSTRVGTHNGTFHCDEALACFMLRLSKRFFGAQIVRTRDPNLLETLDAVVDVGGVYEPRRHRFDHHQKGFHQVFGHGFHTKLSSAGLVYKVFVFCSSLFFPFTVFVVSQPNSLLIPIPLAYWLGDNFKCAEAS